MSARVAAILLALLVVLGGAALYFRHTGSQRPSGEAALGQPLLKNLKAADVEAIAIRGPQGSLTLQRKHDRWTIAERAGFPADYAKVKAFVVKALELRIGQADAVSTADRAQLALLAPGKSKGAGTLVQFEAAGGKSLGAMIVGRKYFKRQPADPATAPADGRFVLLPAKPGTAYVVGNPLTEATTASAAWIDATGFTVGKVESLELRFPQGDGWKISRATPDGAWRLAGAKHGEQLDTSKANAAAYSLHGVALADVAPPQLSAASAGLDRPTVVTATSFAGLTYTLQLGKARGRDYYARLSITGTPRPQRTPDKDEKPAVKKRRDAAYATQLKALEARLPRERALSKYVLLLPKSDFDDLLKQRSGLLEKKPAHKS